MQAYTIFTDSGSDIPICLLKEWNVKYCNISYTFEGNNKDRLTNKEFYKKMRSGMIAKTSGVNIEEFKTAFSEELEKGNDILYLGFSSELSTTFNSAYIASNELKELYPERKIVSVNTLCGSAGLGLLVFLAQELKTNGYSLDEVQKFISEISPNICHWFTVNDLVYLKRSGRVSGTIATLGKLIGIKPILHMDNSGHLVYITKARGRIGSLKALAEKVATLYDEDIKSPILISHADAEEDANKLCKMIKDQTGKNVDFVFEINPGIGAHCGPGTISVFFIGKER